LPQDRRRQLADYGAVLLIRRVEEKIAALFAASRIFGTCHLCIGQEAAAVGVCSALEPGDQVAGSHRGHGHLLAMGGDPARLLGELMGKATGYCRGRGGSQHLSAPEIGFLGTNGITAGGIPVATGAALAAKTLGKDHVVVCFFGDGAASQGAFHEALNMASLWKLPILYACENNGYAMSTPVERTLAGGDLCARAASYAVPARRADGMDVAAAREAAGAMLERVRAGEGPAFLELMTYRFCGHSKSDRLVYRTRDEEAAWAARDPVVTLRRALDAAGLAGEADGLEREIEATVADAARRAADAADADPARAREGVTADG
jgi:pyruvate dehydrogenase E1 component alpha subunit